MHDNQNDNINALSTLLNDLYILYNLFQAQTVHLYAKRGEEMVDEQFDRLVGQGQGQFQLAKQ